MTDTGTLPFDSAVLSDNELLTLRIRLDTELTRRGINFSVGETGEKVAIEHFNSTPGLPNLMAAPTGLKILMRCQEMATGTRSRLR